MEANEETGARTAYVCPKCKSENLYENNIVHVRLKVTEWDQDGEPGAFDYPWQVIDDTIRTVDEDSDGVKRYYCHDCDAEFEVPDAVEVSKAEAEGVKP